MEEAASRELLSAVHSITSSEMQVLFEWAFAYLLLSFPHQSL
jgi:hypothetical protein